VERKNIAGFPDICIMNRNRDLMYVARTVAGKSGNNEQDIECLHNLLSIIETLDRLSACTEIIDLTEFTVTIAKHRVREILRSHNLKPFQFVCNKN
jgi:hypothetical protein